MRAVLAGALVLLGGCAVGAPSPQPAATSTPMPVATASPAPAAPTASATAPATPVLPSPGGDVPPDILLGMLQATSDATGVNLAELRVTRAIAVTWPDGALGCPDPGMSYVQVLVDGYWVEIEAGNQSHDFRSDRLGNWKVCPPGRGRMPAEEDY